MYSKANKILSIAMSAAILLTNMMTPMTAFADEVNEPAQDLESEMPPETEPVSYCLTLPFYDEVSYSVDKNHVETNDNPGSKDIRLAYHEDDKVEFSFQTTETVQVMEIHLKDPKKQEYTFSVDENRKITLFMPAKDLELTLVMEDIPVPDPVSETEQPAEPLPAAEAEGTWEQPVNPDEGINEFDLTAQEVAGDQTSYTAEDLSPGDDPAGGTDENISNNMNMEERSTQADPENRDEETGTETGEDPADAVVETSKISEEASDETAGADSNPDTPGIVLTAETEEDGLPAQGSILTAETLTIPLMDVDFIPETDFTNISFSHETDQVELVSDEVDITNPGTYSTIYRVTHNDGEKMWYVLRPVLVSENTRARETETEGAKGSPDVSDDETEEAEEESDAPSEEEALTEISLADETVMTETESETSFDETQEIPSPEDISERITEDVLEEPSEETTENAAEEMTESITEEVTEDAAAETAAGPYKVSAFADENVAVTFDHEDGLYESGDEVRFSISLIKEMEEPTVIEEITADFDNGVSVTQGIRVNENTGRVTFENLEEEKEVVVEDLPLADPLEDPGPEDEFQLSYEENEDLFSFEMPESNVMLTMMSAPLLAAAADDDDDPVPDKFKLIVKNAVTAPASLSSGYSASTRKWVTFYEDDGTKTKRVAYCVQPKEGSPESGHTYSKDQAELLDGDAGKEKMMTKGLYYLFGGPAWGKKIEYADGSGTVNLKNYLENGAARMMNTTS